MSRGSFSLVAGQLPETLPVFPLSGAVLLPFGRLPLNVFEPRYLNLVADALGQCRLLGMVQPRGPGSTASLFRSPSGAHHEKGSLSCKTVSRQSEPEQSLFTVGCAGRIVHFEETDDGRILMALEGVCRFEILEEATTTGGYLRARVRWTRFLHDLEAPARCDGVDPAAFLESTRSVLAAQGFGIDDSSFGGMDTGTLVDLFGMQLPLSPADKQAVLEATTVADRAGVMLALLRMRAPGVGARETRH